MTSYGVERPALVVGSGVTALGVLRALGRRGIPAFVAPSHAGVERSSRWFRAAPGFAGGALEEYLRVTALDRAVLFPCSDAAALEVSGLSDDLKPRFPSSVPKFGVLSALVDKEGQADLLNAHGVPHPQTWRVESHEQLANLATQLPDNAFIKPRDSQSFFARFGVKALFPATKDELVERLGALLDEGFGTVVQEYVPGPPHNHYFIDGFVDVEGRPRALFARQRLRMYPPLFGNSSATRSTELDSVRPAIGSILGLLESLEYRGIFSAEFKLDTSDGVFRLLEINARPWWYVGFAVNSGVDVVGMLYSDALGRPVDRVESYEVGRTLIYPYYDIQACLRAWRAGELSLPSAVRSWIGAEFPVFSVDDPRPFMVEASALVRGYFGRHLAEVLSGRRSRVSGEAAS